MIRHAECIGYCALLGFLAGTSAHAQGVTLPDFERVDLDNGAVLLLSVKTDVPLVSATAMLRGGGGADPEGQEGLAALFADLLEKGAGARDAAAFADAVDSVGGELHASAELESITVSAEFLARDADLMVELLGDMLLRPALDAGEFGKLRERRVNFIRAAKDTNLHALLPVYAHAFLFSGHPYGRPVGGSEASLGGIGHQDVLDFYRQQIGADRLVVSVSGDFDAAAMRAALVETFGAWRRAASDLPDVPAATRQAGRRVLLVDKPDATQTYFWIGNVGVARDFEQRAALDIANTVFGGRFTSMLNTELRVNAGLTYGAGCSLLRPTRPGSVAMVSYTATATTVAAIDLAVATLGRLHEQGVGDAMIESARNYILGQFPTALETAAQVGAELAGLETWGLGVGYVNDYGRHLVAVDRSAVDAVIAAVYPSPADLVFVMIGDAAQIRDAASRYGTVTEMPITAPQFLP